MDEAQRFRNHLASMGQELTTAEAQEIINELKVIMAKVTPESYEEIYNLPESDARDILLHIYRRKFGTT